MKLISAKKPLESAVIDILMTLPKSKRRGKYVLVITDRLNNLRNFIALRSVSAYVVVVAFFDPCVFKYCVPKSNLLDKCPQFSSRLLYSICAILGVTDFLTSNHRSHVS